MSTAKVKLDVRVEATPTGDDVICKVTHEGQSVIITFSPSSGLDIQVPEDEDKAGS